MANIRLYQFPTKASPVPADLIYAGDSAASFDEVQITIAQLISAYPNLTSLAGLTPANGAIPYSTATAFSLLAPGTSGQLFRSGGAGAPTWTTSTYPATNAVSTLLYASSANVMAALATVNSAGLLTSGSGVPGWVAYTGTGAPVLATSPTITTPKIAQINDAAGLANLTLTSVASAVNNFNLANSATGQPVLFSGVGTDSNIAIQFRSKGTGSVSFYTEALTNQFIFYNGTSGQHNSTFAFPTTAAGRIYTFPDSDGTIALTSGIPSLPLSLANGGTAASLTASNGGIVYSNATTLAILAGTATAGQIVRSGASTTPSWSTATYPSTVSANAILYGSSSNVVGEIATTTAGRAVLSATSVLVQRVSGVVAAANGTSSIPNDNTIPQNTEGTEICTVNITPLSASNILVAKLRTRTSNSAAISNTVAMFWSSAIPNAVVADIFLVGVLDTTAALNYSVAAGSTSSQTFSARIGTSAGTWYVNSNSSAITLGGVIDDGFQIEVCEYTP